jgi:hypothetical protein
MKGRINQVLEGFRSFVASHEDSREAILTVYADVDPTNPDNRKERPAWLIELGQQMKAVREALPEGELKRRASQQRWKAAEEYVFNHLRESKHSGRSVVLFSDLEDFEVIELPVSLPTRAYYGLPQLKHLLFALDMYEKYLVALFSGSTVRMSEVFLSRTAGESVASSTQAEVNPDGRTTTAEKQARRDREMDLRHVREAARAVEAQFMEDPDFNRIVFGGNLERAHAVKNALHPATARLVVAVEPIDAKIDDTALARHVTTIAERYELEYDLAVVADLVERSGSNGAAVMERQRVEAALQRGAVKTLVLPYPIDAEGFDSMIVDATLRNAQVEFVCGAAAERLAEYGGIGADLYFSGA